MMKIKTGDSVRILSGKDKGKVGKIIQVLRHKTNGRVFVVVEGVRVMKKHIRARKGGEKGQILELPTPMDVSKVMLVDPKTSKPTRVGFSLEGGKKSRVARRTGETIA